MTQIGFLLSNPLALYAKSSFLGRLTSALKLVGGNLKTPLQKQNHHFFEGLPLLQYYNSALAGEIGYRKLEAEVNLPKNDDFAFAAAFFNHFTFEP